MAIKGFNLRIDGDMLDKLHSIAEYNGRSATGQIVYMVRMLIEEFEEKHGELGKKDIDFLKKKGSI